MVGAFPRRSQRRNENLRTEAENGLVHVPSLLSSKPAEMRSFYPGADTHKPVSRALRIQHKMIRCEANMFEVPSALSAQTVSIRFRQCFAGVPFVVVGDRDERQHAISVSGGTAGV